MEFLETNSAMGTTNINMQRIFHAVCLKQMEVQLLPRGEKTIADMAGKAGVNIDNTLFIRNLTSQICERLLAVLFHPTGETYWVSRHM